MKIRRILALILALIMCISCVALPVFADGEDNTEKAEENKNILKGPIDNENYYKDTLYGSQKEKLATMELVYSDFGYELYYQHQTGEVAVVNTATGQVLSTNPYDVADNGNPDMKKTGNDKEEKERILSQLIVHYDDNGEDATMTSYLSAALLNQIKMSVIRDGIRVEYTIGKASSKRVVPFRIEKERFETMILEPLRAALDKETMERFEAYYVLLKPGDVNYPKECNVGGPIYALEKSVENVEFELKTFENYITQNTKYTYDEVIKDHEATNYTGSTKVPAVFRMALEYRIDKDGLEVRLPASGIRYDSSLYTLNNIEILPFFGAYRHSEEGYVLLPDGSGTLVRFEDTADDKQITITSKLYNEDFSYYTPSIVQNMQPWVLPVFGMVETVKETEIFWDQIFDEEGNPVLDENGEPTYSQRPEVNVKSQQGFFAIITEGDSLLDITTSSGGKLNKYFATYTIATPRPTDTYPLDGISVSGTTATWTVQTEKKYTGNYRIKYFMLNGEEANYVSMAKLYREYLENSKALEQKKSDSDSIELFFETFGSIKTTERRFGVPVDVMKDLTSFENAKVIIDELASYGIDNLSIKYRGWANGGLDATAPTKISVEKVLGGKKGFADLVEYANDKNVKIFPDFDYTYVSSFSSGDKFDVKKDTSKTVDNRSAVHRTYDPVYQTFMDDGTLIISPNKILGFWNSIEKKFGEFGTGAVSFATLGSDLISDHNKKDSLNRENSKERIIEFLQNAKDSGYEIMLDQGNSYAMAYADNILNVPLDSSNRYVAGEAVPFYGMVLHGYKNFAGEAINLAGDYTYNVLKTIENGADPYFILSYQNANALKTSTTYSKYYSIRYDIWKSDLVETYHTLNLVLAGVKDSKIDNHEFINARHVVVTYENGTKFDIDYATSVLTVNDDYVINFDPELLEYYEKGEKVADAVYELDGTRYSIRVESGESSAIVIKDGKAYSITEFLEANGCKLTSTENK